MPTRRVPVDLLYVRSHDESHSGPVPLICHRPVRELCSHIVARRGSLDGYWAWSQCPESGRRAHLDDWRRRTRWARWLPMTPRPTVTAIERDRLLVVSGLEQAAFAKALDRRWMSVEMPDESAQKWDRRSVETLRRVVQETRRKEFYNPVLHDDFRRARIIRPDSIRIDRIRRLLGPHGPGLRGLDIGCNMGYTSHMLQRHGVAMTGIDFDEQHLAVARALDDTYGLGTPFVSGRFEQFAAAETFDIVVLLTVMYHALNRHEREAIAMISHIDQLAPAALIWESGSYPKREIELITEHSGLTTYLPLGPTQATGKDRELGVFVRPGTALGDGLVQRYETELAPEFQPVSVMAAVGR